MVQTMQGKEINLDELATRFEVQLVEDEEFFREWQDELPEINEAEKQRLDRVKVSYSHLIKYPPLLENTVKIVVLAPLLDLAGFLLQPFRIQSETSINIESEDEGVIVKGRIDVLVIFERFWLVAIESKKAEFSVEAGRPQLLSYLLANPHPEKPAYGLITNGSDFLFIKLMKEEEPKYAYSRLFSLFNPGNDLYMVLRILKRLAALAINN
ncbi:MAG: restriction endonuclease subunit R [Gomphosphaeria aponina SAG 52.96 = DSM 107014]|uniref:Restriction endonuclease subunit R n=1 Tax=Gomphosphaeria aponina SAG 52.96 = DSM 107014 TaxID=1521640 RepID=A0A941GU61_9CHRO|nr:restriction endonuclease subunit R [Gomphosphaeria aponina SAG 52.96 = DSM 107014]